MDKKTREILSKAIKEHKKPGAGGKKFGYIKGEDVIARLNEAFDYGWNSKVLNSWITDTKTKQVMIWVELTAEGTSHQGFGGAEVALYSQGPRIGEPVDISNSYKSGLTNAIKNAAKQFGIGLVSEEVGAFEEEKSKPFPEIEKPPTNVPADKLVSSSTTLSTKKEELINELAKEIEKSKNNDSKSLAETFKESSTQEENKPAFTPSVVSDDSKVNDVQVGAMNAICKMRNLDRKEIITASLGSTTKVDFEDLTTEEAREVLKHLHSTKGD